MTEHVDVDKSRDDAAAGVAPESASVANEKAVGARRLRARTGVFETSWALIVLLLTAAPFVITVAVAIFDVPVDRPPPLVHTLLGWSSALLALLISVLASLRFSAASRTRVPTATLAVVMPVVALLDGVHALGPWLASAQSQATLVGLPLAGGGLESIAWQASRWLLALALVASLAMVWTLDARRRQLRVMPLLLSGVGLGSVLMLAHRGGLLLAPRWLELGPWALFTLAGLGFARSLAHAHPTPFYRGLLLATMPLAVAQIEMLFGWAMAAHAHQLLAYAVLAGGALADFAHSQRGTQEVHLEHQEVQEALRSTTQELERLDMQRALHEEKRREAEASLRMLAKAVETMSLGVTITDMEGRIVYVNPADARVHGYQVDDLMGRDARIYAASHEDQQSGFHGVEPWARERINCTSSGAHFPVRLVSDRVRSESGEPIATVTICEDIRERIRIREALERRDRVLEAVAFAAERFLSEPSWEDSVGEVLERLGEATAVDRAYLELVHQDQPFGVDDAVYFWAADDEEMASVMERGEPRQPVVILDRWQQAMHEGATLCGRRAELPAEEQAVLEERGIGSLALVPLFVRSVWEGCLCLESSAEDRDWSHAEREALRTAARTFSASIERRRDEEALAASEAKYRDLLENAHDLIQSVSPDGRFQFVNRAWKETLGYSADEISQLTVWEVVRPAAQDPRRDVLQNMLADDGMGRVEALFIAKDGREIDVEGVVTCRFEDGLPIAAQGIFRDITERRLVDRMKQDFLSTVSHELRTPLTSIIASLGLLDSGRLAAQPERQAELVTVAYRNSNRLLKLINNLLDLQKLAASKMTFKRTPVDVESLFDEAIVGIRAYSDQARIELVIGDIPDGLRVVADKDRLNQVLINLLSNAIKFSTAGDQVLLHAELRDVRAALVVKDHGPGIPEDFRDRLFEQFTQADPSQTRSSGGSGLGLSIAKGLVEGMNGSIDLETHMGEGTTFYVELPIAD